MAPRGAGGIVVGVFVGDGATFNFPLWLPRVLAGGDGERDLDKES